MSGATAAACRNAGRLISDEPSPSEISRRHVPYFAYLSSQTSLSECWLAFGKEV